MSSLAVSTVSYLWLTPPQETLADSSKYNWFSDSSSINCYFWYNFYLIFQLHISFKSQIKRFLMIDLIIFMICGMSAALRRIINIEIGYRCQNDSRCPNRKVQFQQSPTFRSWRRRLRSRLPLLKISPTRVALDLCRGVFVKSNRAEYQRKGQHQHWEGQGSTSVPHWSWENIIVCCQLRKTNR